MSSEGSIRVWRRRQVRSLLRAVEAEARLRIPISQAVGLVYSLTSYATWSALVNDSRLSPDAAVAVVRHTVRTAILSVDPG